MISYYAALERFTAEFYSVFGLSLTDYLVPELARLGTPVFDIIKLDDWLVEKYPDYVDGVSMMECITAHYGVRGNNLIETIIHTL